MSCTIFSLFQHYLFEFSVSLCRIFYLKSFKICDLFQPLTIVPNIIQGLNDVEIQKLGFQIPLVLKTSTPRRQSYIYIYIYWYLNSLHTLRIIKYLTGLWYNLCSAVAVNAGCTALPALLNIKQVMQQRQVEFYTWIIVKCRDDRIFGRFEDGWMV